MAHRNSCFCEVRKLDNEHLKMLLKEMHKIAMFDVPKSYLQSDTMQHLFRLEKVAYIMRSGGGFCLTN